MGKDGVVAIVFMGDHHLVLRRSDAQERPVFSDYIVEAVGKVDVVWGFRTLGFASLPDAVTELRERADSYDVVTATAVACRHNVSYEMDCFECDVDYEYIYGEAVPA